MGAPLRRLRLKRRIMHSAALMRPWPWLGRSAAIALLLLSAWLPMAWAALQALLQASAPSGWQGLMAAPQLPAALTLSIWTGIASTAVAWWISALLISRGFVQQRLSLWLRGLPAMLATPHAALAIGLLFLLAPSGWLLRLASPGLTGFDLPPAWQTTQDPSGLGLILALCVKEIPFLLWIAAAQLEREDLRRRWQAEYTVALTLGYRPQAAFRQVVWPQLAPRLAWPALAVLAYSLTVVDMALVIGPTAPPTLAVLAWQWLQDADMATHQQGAAAGGLLALVVAGLGGLVLWQLRARPLGGRLGRGPRPPKLAHGLFWWASISAVGLLRGVYAAALLALAVGSFAGLWPFPDVLPQAWTTGAWQSVWQSSHTLTTTLTLASASAFLALLWSVAWFELLPRQWEARLRPLLYLSLVMPGVLWVLGLHALSLQGQLDGTWLGLLWVHLLMTLPYVVLALSSSYLGFDPRYAQLSASLGRGRWAFLLQIKWPLLKRALASAFAIGFAVSVAQYLPTLYVGAGRFSTVTTEAVALAAGAQRSLTSAYAWLQWSLPLLVFGAAALAGRPRQFTAPGCAENKP